MWYLVEGAGPDVEIEADGPDDAAMEAAVAQHGDGVRVSWFGGGPDSACAEYEVERDEPGARRPVALRRIVVRRAAAPSLATVEEEWDTAIDAVAARALDDVAARR